MIISFSVPDTDDPFGCWLRSRADDYSESKVVLQDIDRNSRSTAQPKRSGRDVQTQLRKGVQQGSSKSWNRNQNRDSHRENISKTPKSPRLLPTVTYKLSPPSHYHICWCRPGGICSPSGGHHTNAHTGRQSSGSAPWGREGDKRGGTGGNQLSKMSGRQTGPQACVCGSMLLARGLGAKTPSQGLWSRQSRRHVRLVMGGCGRGRGRLGTGG